MAKKSKKNGSHVKDISEMTDTEFVKNIDYLSSPYYRAYVNARVRAELGYNAWQDGVDMREAERAERVTEGKKRAYVNKRHVAVILITVLLLVMLAVSVIGLIDGLTFSKYFSVFAIPNSDGGDVEYVTLTDMTLGLFGGENRASSLYFKSILSDKLDGAATMQKITFYAPPVASLLLFVITAFGFLKSLLSLFGGAKNGAYHKYKFGFISILLFLCSAVVVLGGAYTVKMTAEAMGDFFLIKSNVLNAGYAAYAILIIPVITFILSCVSYRKEKKVEKVRR